MSLDRHLPLINSSLYSLNNNSASDVSSINININSDSADGSNGYSSVSSSLLYSLPTSSSNSVFLNHDNPTLLHRWSHGFSVLSIAISKKHKLLFSGTQDSKILIYNLTNFQKIGTIDTDHNGSILNLIISNNENYLFSTSSDSLIKIWDISGLNRDTEHDSHNGIKEITTIYSLIDIGDIFSIALSKNLNILFFGSQNTSIQWVNLSDKQNFVKVNKSTLNKLPFIRYDKFFDSKPGVRSLEQNSSNAINEKIEKFSNKLEKTKTNLALIEVPLDNVIPFAHNGFIYDLKIVSKEVFQNSNFPITPDEKFEEYLVSVGGDGLVKIWGIHNEILTNGPQLKFLTELDNDDPTLTITINGFFLYCGLTDGKVKVWDLSTFQLIKIIDTDNSVEINSVAYYTNLNCLFKGTEFGCCKYNLNTTGGFVPSPDGFTSEWNSNEKSIQSVDILYNYNNSNDNLLVSAGHSGISIWNLPNKVNDYGHITVTEDFQTRFGHSNDSNKGLVSNNDLLKILSNFISFKTISQKPELYIEDSRNCANFLNNIFKKYGAYESKLLPVENANPIVYALFKANKPKNLHNEKVPRVIWYGHYDVVETENDKGWDTDPFTMIAQDGYLHARGITDNKGPILSSIFAVSDLSRSKSLSSDVVFLLEGEEESGSFGFQSVISTYRHLIGEIDWILFSNSYWLDDYTPCLNYGLRGLISAEIEVSSEKPDRHSGVDGGVSREPTIDLVNLLSKLTDTANGRVLIPDYYKPILPICKEELQLYQNIIERIVPNDSHNDLNINNLLKKWRLPSLTVHRVKVSGPRNTTIIPKVASSAISMRIVPNQDIETIKKNLVNYLGESFKQFDSNNTLKIKFIKETEPWLGNLDSKLYKILNEAIISEWKLKPLFIREGGSIPSIRFLEKFFNANAAQIPCGQSSDNAHLNNERLRIINLFKLKKILFNVFNAIPANDLKTKAQQPSDYVSAKPHRKEYIFEPQEKDNSLKNNENSDGLDEYIENLII